MKERGGCCGDDGNSAFVVTASVHLMHITMRPSVLYVLSYRILTQSYEAGVSIPIIEMRKLRPKMFNLATTAQFVNIRTGIPKSDFRFCNSFSI